MSTTPSIPLITSLLSSYLPNHSHTTSSHIYISRILLCICFIILIISSGIFTYKILWISEHKIFYTQFHSASYEIFSELNSTLKRAKYASKLIGTITSLTYPDKDTWPYIYMNGYQDLSDDMEGLANVQFQILPLVHNYHIEKFEKFAEYALKQDPLVPPNAGTSSFGFGVFSFDESDPEHPVRYHDTTGYTEHSQYTFVTPVIHYLNGSSKTLMYNSHHEERRVKAIDSAYECGLQGFETCAAMTDLIQLLRDDEYRPTTIIYSPIHPRNNPDEVVGFTSIPFSWDTAMYNILAKGIDGVDCVIQSETQSYTFELLEGIPQLLGEGDLHDAEFTSMGISRPAVLSDSLASTQAHYTMTIYPTKKFYNQFHTNIPILATAISLTVIIFTSCLFLTYDYFVNKESTEKEQVLQAKRVFVRYVSHEIRTPLNTVKLGLRVLEEELEPLSRLGSQDSTDSIRSGVQLNTDFLPPNKCNELVQLTHEIQDSTGVAVTVLNDLLQYDKIEVGQMKIDRRPLCIWPLLQSTVNLFVVQAKEAGISLQLTGNEDGSLSRLCVLGDKNRIAQVIRNVVSNSLKFSPRNSVVQVSGEWFPSGSPKVKWKIDASDSSVDANGAVISYLNARPDGSFHISVVDNGAGISKSDQKLLFKEGAQFNPNELQAGQGSGLGLWISKSIVEMHNGSIWAVSDGLGMGTTFHIEFPLHRFQNDVVRNALVPTPKPISSSASQCSALSVRNSPIPTLSVTNTKTTSSVVPVSTQCAVSHLRILVVDDVASNRKILTRILTRRGYECDTAVDGVDCLKMMETTAADHYCCIMMDFQMPNMNGPEATRRIREMGFKSLKIIGVTGNVMSGDVDYFLESGANHVLEKPLNIELFDALMAESHC